MWIGPLLYIDPCLRLCPSWSTQQWTWETDRSPQMVGNWLITEVGELAGISFSITNTFMPCFCPCKCKVWWFIHPCPKYMTLTSKALLAFYFLFICTTRMWFDELICPGMQETSQPLSVNPLIFCHCPFPHPACFPGVPGWDESMMINHLFPKTPWHCI